MKPSIKNVLMRVLLTTAFLAGTSLTAAAAECDGQSCIHPGRVSGSVSVAGHQITRVIVRAMDDVMLFSASKIIEVPGGSTSVNYTLTVEGNRNYYLLAETGIAGEDNRTVITPVFGPVYVPIEADTGDTIENFSLSVNPAFFTGTISTTPAGHTVNDFSMYAEIFVPQFNDYFRNLTSAYDLSAPGEQGREYALMVTPGYQCKHYANISVDGIAYTFVDVVTAPNEGQTLIRNFPIDVTAATIYGSALLGGTATTVTGALMFGESYFPPPSRQSVAPIGDMAIGDYTLNVTAGVWQIQPQFDYALAGALSGLTGYLWPPLMEVMVAEGEHIRQDFIVDPGFIAGTVTLAGANTDIGKASYVRAYSAPSGYGKAEIQPETGQYLLVASPGTWQFNELYFKFDYPAHPEPSLWSALTQHGFILAPYTVSPGGTVSVDFSYGTATVTLLYYVAGGGQLSSPEFHATGTETPYVRADAYGSPELTTEGRAVGTLFPGTYSIEAFAIVGGSRTEFGGCVVTVAEGDQAECRVTLLPAPTTLTYTGDTLVQVNMTAILAALLVDEAGRPIPGAEIYFQAGDQTCAAYAGTDGSASCAVAISTAGVYPVTAQFAGDALHRGSGTSAVLVVYNPEGGFVTGGGWLLPDGADDMLPGGSPYGKTNFGFIARYRDDTTIPHGNVELQYHNGNINLKSVALEWLVLNGNWAVFQGIAAVNGQGQHPFMVEVRDGQFNGGAEADRFIIKVWTEGSATTGALLYKASGDLKGGSVVIHVK